MPNLSTIARPADGPMVIDLRGHQGNYESKEMARGQRTFGLWSMTPVKPGDLIIKPSTMVAGQKCLYIVVTAERSFEGREGDDYWKGTMNDAIELRLCTPAINAAVARFN